MSSRWMSPKYRPKAPSGKTIPIDVTSSISFGLGPNKTIGDRLIPRLKASGIRTVVDFGAGALRHTIPLLEAGFEVCAVEYKEAFERPAAKEALTQAGQFANFHRLCWPNQFLESKKDFGAALLVYVLQVIPEPKDRNLILREVGARLPDDGLLLYAARYGQISEEDRKHRVKDGFFRGSDREFHSFYREWDTSETHAMMKRFDYEFLENWSARGTDQWILYGRYEPRFA